MDQYSGYNPLVDNEIAKLADKKARGQAPPSPTFSDLFRIVSHALSLGTQGGPSSGAPQPLGADLGSNLLSSPATVGRDTPSGSAAPTPTPPSASPPSSGPPSSLAASGVGRDTPSGSADPTITPLSNTPQSPPAGGGGGDGSTAPWTDGGGFSSLFNPAIWSDLAQDPAQLARLWAKHQGLNPNSDNPLLRAMMNQASRAKGVFDLLHRTGAGANTDPSPDAYLDWFPDFMKNPIQFSAEQGKGLLQQALDSAKGGNLFWESQLGMPDAQNADPDTGRDFGARDSTLGDQAGMLANLFVSAFGGAIDPTYLQGIVSNINRKALDYKTAAYDSQSDTAGAPRLDQGWQDWLMQNRTMPMGIGSG